MRITCFPKSCNGLCLGLLAALGLSACRPDGGVVGIDGSNPLPPLAVFTGIAQKGEGTGVDVDKLGQLENPRVALVWQFAGLRAYRNTHEEPLFSADFPLRFTGRLQDPPPQDVMDPDEVAIGGIWLYSDADDNGRLDRLVHPELAARNRAIDSLHARFDSLTALVRALSVRSDTRREIKDTFSVLPGGAILRLSGGGRDTVWRPRPGLASGLWADAIRSEYRILADLDGWESFLIGRKKLDDRTLKTLPDRDGALTVEFGDRIRLSPRPGSEGAFAAVLETAAAARMEMFYAFERAYGEGIKAGWHDYPYQGDPLQGQDWVLGRSRRWFVLYLKNGRALRDLLAAESSSAFSIRGLSDLHAGYNLMHCDEQYRCEVRSFRDTVVVEFGETEAFFNPPSVAPEKPIAAGEAVPKTLPADSLRAVEGGYAYLPFRNLHVVAEAGSLWADVPGAGLFRFAPAGGQRYFSTLSGMQMKFALGAGGRASKVFVYVGGEQGIGTPIGEAQGWSAVRDRVLRIAGNVAAAKPAEPLARFAGLFEAGKDTVQVKVSADDSGLLAKLPGLALHAFRGREDGGFASAESEIALRFEPGRGGASAYLIVDRAGTETRYPNLDPLAAMDTVAVADTVGWRSLDSSGGSAPDRFRSHDGKARYGCASDGTYLQAGDGLLDSLDRANPWDSVSLAASGDRAVFRITGLAGRMAALDLSACGSALDAAAKVRLRFRGGPSGSIRSESAGADRWIKPDKAGTGLRIGPFRVASDPYFIEVTRLRTAEPERPFAFDRYRLSAGGEE